MLHSVFSLITWIKKVLTKQPVERPQQILANYGHISWKAFELLRSFFEAFRISWFIWKSIFDHFQVLLTWLLTVFLNSNVNKTVWFFLVSRNREILSVKSLKSKKKNLALTLFYYVSRETWLGNSKNLISIDQSTFYIYLHPREFENV